MSKTQRTDRVHVLKTWPEPYIAIVHGRKHHEIRVDDRGYAVGDVLHLKEWEPNPSGRNVGQFTGRECNVVVTYVTAAGSWGLPSNLCVMSIEVVP